jgi:hypothetical protein
MAEFIRSLVPLSTVCSCIPDDDADCHVFFAAELLLGRIIGHEASFASTTTTSSIIIAGGQWHCFGS